MHFQPSSFFIPPCSLLYFQALHGGRRRHKLHKNKGNVCMHLHIMNQIFILLCNINADDIDLQTKIKKMVKYIQTKNTQATSLRGIKMWKKNDWKSLGSTDVKVGKDPSMQRETTADIALITNHPQLSQTFFFKHVFWNVDFFVWKRNKHDFWNKPNVGNLSNGLENMSESNMKRERVRRSRFTNRCVLDVLTFDLQNGKIVAFLVSRCYKTWLFCNTKCRQPH